MTPRALLIEELRAAISWLNARRDRDTMERFGSDIAQATLALTGLIRCLAHPEVASGAQREAASAIQALNFIGDPPLEGVLADIEELANRAMRFALGDGDACNRCE